MLPFYLNVLLPGQILIPSTSGDLRAPEITMFCSKVMMIKGFSPIKSRRPWPPISISHLFQHKAFLVLGCSFFYTLGVFV